MKWKLASNLPTVGEVIHRQTAVQTESQAEVTQAACQVVFHQDVGALQVTVDYRHLQAQEKRGCQFQNKKKIKSNKT